jgi:hypothetical protein
MHKAWDEYAKELRELSIWRLNPVSSISILLNEK